ncbi:unnamed protein product, partial [Iphiclides podalirius]
MRRLRKPTMDGTPPQRAGAIAISSSVRPFMFRAENGRAFGHPRARDVLQLSQLLSQLVRLQKGRLDVCS